jgi:23S rRNA (cytosine1962-C5)-methyltransferase
VAFEGLAHTWSSERTLQRQGAFLLVDKPGGVACGAGAAGSLDLCARRAEQGLGKFRAIEELPERASGVTLLVADGERARDGVPAAMRRYVLGIDELRLSARGQLRASQPGLAPIEYEVSAQQQGRGLLLVRTALSAEQVLRSFAAAGQPVVGADPAGASTRLLLHVAGLEAGGLAAAAALPSEFESWLRGAPQRPPGELARALSEGALVRAALWPRFQAYRLCGEEGGEIAGVTAERYGEHALLDLSTEEAWAERERLAECLMDHGARGVYVKRRLRADLRKQDAAELAPALPLRGEAAPESLRVQQGELQFSVRLADGLSTGLFLDQRESWQRVRAGAAGRSLLNLFCYTGAFSVAAASGGAPATVSVDLSKRALSRLRENLELNGLSGPQHRLLASDVLVWLGRAVRAGRRFGWIVLDPPSFGTRKGGVLRAERDYAGMVAGALALLEPHGRLLCVSHQRGFSSGDLRGLVLEALQASGRAGTVHSWVGGWDAPTLPGVSGTKSVLAEVA